jgi:hypothetical protein
MFYEYKCPVCGFYDVVNRPVEDREHAPCTRPDCKGIMDKVMLTPPGITAHSLPTRKRYNFMKPAVKNAGKP